MSTQEPSQPSTTRAYSIQGNTIDRDAKQNGSGISENVAHTLDAADRHGVMAAEPGMKQQTYVMAVDCRNGTESPDTNGTLQAKDGGGTSVNLNNVVRTSGGGNEPMGRTERENLRK